MDIVDQKGGGGGAGAGGGGEQKNDELIVAVLIDELQNDDVQIRLNSMKKLNTIAKVLGPERTATELIPYLNEFVDDEDDILVVLSEQLGKLLGCVGGTDNAHILLVPLETLSGIEEAVVRDKAVESIIRIIAVLSKSQLATYIMPLVKRLATGKWFTSRVSSSSLFEIVYSNVSPGDQRELRGLFVRLCEDETPMVRRAACQCLGNFASAVEYKDVLTQLVPPFVKLTQDPQDSVRLRTVENCVAIAKLLNKEDRELKILPVIYALCKDKSWRVRYMVADKFCELIGAAGTEKKNCEEMTEIFVRLLQDGEEEVRTAASHKVTSVAKIVGPKLTAERLVKPVESLVKDECQYTRAALASVIMGLATCVPKDCVLQVLLPQFLQMLKDDDPEVRLNIISKLESVNQVIGVELLAQSLLPAIDELAKDKKWRIRLAIIKHVPLLARKLGPEIFQKQLCSQCIAWLKDPVWSIRVAAAENVKEIAKTFESKWTSAYLMPEIKALAQSKRPGHRMSAVYAIRHLAEVVGQQMCADELLPILTALAKDPVANVRFTVAKSLQNLSRFVGSGALRETLLPLLSGLAAKDRDTDVKYFAGQSLANVRGERSSEGKSDT